MLDNKLILAKDQYYSLNNYETQLNNNVLVVGTSGAGKTRSIVTPNLLQATGSYIVSDPKGNLYDKYREYLSNQGYRVMKLDFTNPMESEGYNFFKYIKSEIDIVKVAHMITYSNGNKGHHGDPFWDEAAQLLLVALIAYLKETASKEEQHLKNVLKLAQACLINEHDSDEKGPLDNMFKDLEDVNPNSFAVEQYKMFRIAAGRTLKSILISINARTAAYSSKEIAWMLSRDTVDIPSIGAHKTALFVVVSDTDRSMDNLANLFFTQAMNELCRYADQKCDNQRLPVDVRFILDDFATNVKIEEFPRMIASIRSRGISTMLMIQAESQLEAAYGHDGKTIIGNCDTYAYLGGNDVETAYAISRRCDVPLRRILDMPVGTNWIFRRGQKPVNGENFELEPFLKKKLNEAAIGREMR